MKVTIEAQTLNEIEIIKNLLSILSSTMTFQIEEKSSFIEKGDKSIYFQDLFSIWKDNPMDIKTIREKAWRKNDSL